MIWPRISWAWSRDAYPASASPKMNRQPLGWRDQLGGAGHSEEEALQLVIPQRARWSIRIVEEGREELRVHRGHVLRPRVFLDT